jgi:hypothetical protein
VKRRAELDLRICVWNLTGCALGVLSFFVVVGENVQLQCKRAEVTVHF